MVWLGKADCIASMEIARNEDPGGQVLGDVLTTWGKAMTVGYTGRLSLARAIEVASEMKGFGNGYGVTPELMRPEFNAALRAAVALETGYGVSKQLDATTLGRWCKKSEERIVDGLLLKTEPSEKGVANGGSCRRVRAGRPGRAQKGSAQGGGKWVNGVLNILRDEMADSLYKSRYWPPPLTLLPLC